MAGRAAHRARCNHDQDVLLGRSVSPGGISRNLFVPGVDGAVRCPSSRCLNHRTKGRADVKYMLLIMGFREGEGMPQSPSSGAPSAEEFMKYQQELEQSGVHVDSGLL